MEYQDPCICRSLEIVKSAPPNPSIIALAPGNSALAVELLHINKKDIIIQKRYPLMFMLVTYSTAYVESKLSECYIS